MLYYIQSDVDDPYYNLALEQHVFDSLDRRHSYFMLWQNRSSVIVGRHQDTASEIDSSFLESHHIIVARRLSGGGAVYHDLGNLNYTFITDCQGLGAFDFTRFCRPVIQALAELGVHAETAGRNDMYIDGKKFSGNAQYIKEGRVMHHGTLMYDTDTDMVKKALTPSEDKVESRGVRSVRSGVTNIRPYVDGDYTVLEFRDRVRDYMRREEGMQDRRLLPGDYAAVEELREAVYSQWSWNYGSSPKHSVHKRRYVQGCGSIDIYMQLGYGGVLEGVAFRGDYFSTKGTDPLVALLIGHRLEEGELKASLRDADIGGSIYGLDADGLIRLMLS